MKFPYQERPRNPSDAFPNVTSRAVPIIPVTLSFGDRSITLDALVDSGADNCIFPGMLGVGLGIDVNRGPRQNIFGLGGRVIEARFHRVKLSMGSMQCEVYAGFTFDTIGMSGLLGQRGFLDHFRVVFDRSENCVMVNRRAVLQRLLTKFGW